MFSQKVWPVLAGLLAAASAQTISGKTLKIMPLGDSITVGSCGHLGNGYRLHLADLLDGNQVNFVGSSTDGSARDNQFEAHPGYGINSIRLLALNSLGTLPNVYLIHAGTNDLLLTGQKTCAPAGTGSSSDVCQQAADNLANLLGTVYYTGAAMIVAQITPARNSSDYNSRITVYNQLVAKLVSDRLSQGWRVQLANMQSLVTVNDITDTCSSEDPGPPNSNIVHPNDGGYQKMARVWYNAIANASAYGLILQPTRQPYANGYAERTCDSVSNSQSGVNWCGPIDNVYPGRGNNNPNVYVGVSCKDNNNGGCTCTDSYNSAGFNVAKTGSCAEMSIGFTSSVRWADLNGDGRQENVYVTGSGALNTSLNTGVLTFPNFFGCLSIQTKWRELGVINVGPSTTKRYQVQLADLDGDTRAEYIIVSPNGAATGYYNTGSPSTNDNNIAVNFARSGVQSAPSFGVSGIGVRFVDFDGDGRADYVWVGANGNLQVWLNRGSTSTQGTAQVDNWASQGSIGPAVLAGTIRENIQIVDINADGRADYLIFNRTDGTVGAYLNKAPNQGSNVPNWQWAGIIADSNNGTSIRAGTFLSEMVFADPDGDGNYDYLVTNAADSSSQGLKNRCPNQNIG